MMMISNAADDSDIGLVGYLFKKLSSIDVQGTARMVMRWEVQVSE